jgi:hypothetical protein
MPRQLPMQMSRQLMMQKQPIQKSKEKERRQLKSPMQKRWLREQNP